MVVHSARKQYLLIRVWHAYSGALQHMQQSSAEAAALFREAGATGCTDVTGFGLIGHLGEMTRASQVSHAGLLHIQPSTHRAWCGCDKLTYTVTAQLSYHGLAAHLRAAMLPYR